MPPGNSFKYEVKYSDPATTLEFFHYFPRHFFSRQAPRDQVNTEKLMKRMIRDSLDPVLRNVTMSTDDSLMHGWKAYDWHEAAVYMSLRIRPSRVRSEEQKVGLTWGTWTNALIGINKFNQAYPGLDFDFDVLIEDKGYDEFHAAWGQFRDLTEPSGRVTTF